MPFLPVMQIRKCCFVYNLLPNALHGMEEVIDSIPINVNCAASATLRRSARIVITETGGGPKSDQIQG